MNLSMLTDHWKFNNKEYLTERSFLFSSAIRCKRFHLLAVHFLHAIYRIITKNQGIFLFLGVGGGREWLSTV